MKLFKQKLSASTPQTTNQVLDTIRNLYDYQGLVTKDSFRLHPRIRFGRRNGFGLSEIVGTVTRDGNHTKIDITVRSNGLFWMFLGIFLPLSIVAFFTELPTLFALGAIPALVIMAVQQRMDLDRTGHVVKALFARMGAHISDDDEG